MEERQYILEQKENKEKEMVNHPQHYQAEDLECIDIMEKLYGIDMTFSFCALNAFKYTWRFNNKEKASEDLRKSAWYCTKAAELLEKINN